MLWLEVVALQQAKTKSQDNDYSICLEKNPSVDVASGASLARYFRSLVHSVSLVNYS